MELYYKYQPVTWYIGVIEAAPDGVARVVQSLYIPSDDLKDIRHETGTVDAVFTNMEPLGPPHGKFLLIKTKDGRTALFTNTLFEAVELPTWYAAEKLNASAYYVCNVPNTISRDQRSGAYGGRKLEFRTPETPFNQEPKFGIQLINDAGKWCFYRFGEKQSFENEKAYRSFRKTDRFPLEMLVAYCSALGIPVYDRDWYTDNAIVIERYLKPNEHGMNYKEARAKLRIDQDKHTALK